MILYNICFCSIGIIFLYYSIMLQGTSVMTSKKSKSKTKRKVGTAKNKAKNKSNTGKVKAKSKAHSGKTKNKTKAKSRKTKNT